MNRKSKNIKKKSIDKEMTEELKYRCIIDLIVLIVLVLVIAFTYNAISNKSIDIITNDSEELQKDELVNSSNTDYTKDIHYISSNIKEYDLSSIKSKLYIEDILAEVYNCNSEFEEQELEKIESLVISSEDLSTFIKNTKYIKQYTKEDEYIIVEIDAFSNCINSIRIDSNNNKLKEQVFNTIVEFVLLDILSSDSNLKNEIQNKDSITLINKNTDIINIEQIEINSIAKYIKINNLNSVDIIYSKDLPNIEDVLSFNNFDTGTLEFIKAFNDLETIQLLTENSILSIEEIHEFNNSKLKENIKTDKYFRLVDSVKYLNNKDNSYWSYIDEQDGNIYIKIQNNSIEINIKSESKLDLITIMNMLTLCYNNSTSLNVESLRDEVAETTIENNKETTKFNCELKKLKENNSYKYKITIEKEEK